MLCVCAFGCVSVCLCVFAMCISYTYTHCPCMKWNERNFRSFISIKILSLVFYILGTLRYDTIRFESNSVCFLLQWLLLVLLRPLFSSLVKNNVLSVVCCCCSFISIFLSIRQDFKMNVDYNKWTHSTNKIHCAVLCIPFHMFTVIMLEIETKCIQHRRERKKFW